MAHATDTLVDDVKVVAADASELARQTAEKSAASVAGALDKALAPLQRVQDRASATQQAAVEGARAAARARDDYVRQAPWASMGAAAVVGIWIGFLLARR
jgi:ElaB/YqjD/DUF883 family membrane-anchored ribosome-binding protein